MFLRNVLDLNGQKAECREEILTGIKCRISPSREERGLNNFQPFYTREDGDCVFCPENIEKVTPCFENGERIQIGESITFPNSFPFAENHIVTVMTKEHNPAEITERQIRDSLNGQFTALKGRGEHPTINWNYLPSAGASMIHPHLQGFSGRVPTYLTSVYIGRSGEYYQKTGKNYWQLLSESEKESERFLFGDEVIWCANPVPLGEKEIRGYLPICSIDDFGEYIPEVSAGIKEVIGIYHRAGNHAFNMSIKFGNHRHENYFRAFVSLIARIDPNPMSVSDTAFMERLHYEPVIMTIPELIKEKYCNL